MEQPRAIAADPRRSGAGRFALVGGAVVLAAYTATLAVVHELGFLDALAGAAANAVPLVLFGVAARQVAIDHIVRRGVAGQVVGHALLGSAFALLAYWLLVVLLGLLNGVSATEFAVTPFPSRAMAWQLLENVTTYGIVAMSAYLHVRPEPVALFLGEAPADGGERERPLSRYFIRSGDDIRPINVDAIVSIAGADDYAEVATTEGRHLVRMTLAEFEKALDPARFIRVHRSRIVNLERIARAEPAGGGRLLLHMEDGETIQASRTGSRLLRERVL
ncbi:MAG TPA: LytTR family DNA-binding domain-containing protein [Allosphingosinicella sp.]|jgi:hypothetical protein|nr:LytTR family DNA-binding domain-containing protein [Allosphingosinicella sp.]